MTLPAELLNILACPEDKGPLYYLADKNLLYNPRLACTYDVQDGIPVMLIEERTNLTEREKATLEAVVAERQLRPTFELPPDGSPDTVGMRTAWEGLADQAENALAGATPFAAAVGEFVAKRWPAAADGTGGPSGVVIAGMGGSGVAGDITRAATEHACQVPLDVVKGYELPAHVGPNTLLVAVSFSGNTEETLAVARAALDADAALLAVTCGGQLGALAVEVDAPTFTVDEAIPMPRAAVAAVSVAPLVALEAAGVLAPNGSDGTVAEQVAAAVAQLSARTDELSRRGAAFFGRELTARIAGFDDRLINITAAGTLGAAAAGRWKTQLNENAKLPVLVSVAPELCHNELTGWDIHPAYAGAVTPVLLRHDYEHPQNARRLNYLTQVHATAGIHEPVTVQAEGDGRLAQLFDLVCIGDFFSLEVAAALGRDPGPVDVLADLKSHLAVDPAGSTGAAPGDDAAEPAAHPAPNPANNPAEGAAQ